MPKERTNDRWTEYPTPYVEEDDAAAFRYRVQSFTDPERWHLVDMTDRDGRGACDCMHFQTVANPNLRKQGYPIPYAPGRHGVTECKHIAAAKSHMDEHVIRPMLANCRNGIASPIPS